MFQIGRLTGFGRRHDFNTPSGGHRYWRISFIDLPSGSTNLEISELQVLVGGLDVTSAATKTSSIAPDSGTFSSLFDASTGTAPSWTQAHAEAGSSFWIMFDFGGSPKSIDGVKQAGFTTSTRYMFGFTLQYSDDNITWTSSASKTNLTYPGNNTLSSLYSFGSPPTSNRRYYRFFITANAGDPSWTAFTGIQLHSTLGGIDRTKEDMTCTGSSSYPGEDPSHAINDTIGPGSYEWVTATSAPFPHWWTVDLNTGTAPLSDLVVVEYVMESQRVVAAGARTPSAWFFQMSSDNVTFYDVDVQSGVTWSSPLQTQTFVV